MDKQFSQNARVCFVGDSITANGKFISKIFAYYNTHCPEKNVRIYNCGVSGDCARLCTKRLEEDVYIYNPTEIVLMMGMNDLWRNHFAGENPAEVEKTTLRAREEHLKYMHQLCTDFAARGLPITLCSATPYDEITEHPESTENFIGCNGELAMYASLYAEAMPEISFKNRIDFNAPMTALLQELHDLQAPSFIGSDRVHPGDTGHDIMAALFLRGQGFAGIPEPTAEALRDGTFALPDFSPANRTRMEAESVLRGLGFVEWNMSWPKDGLTTAEKIAYWQAHREDAVKMGVYHTGRVDAYVQEKANEPVWLEKYLAATEAFLQEEQ